MRLPEALELIDTVLGNYPGSTVSFTNSETHDFCASFNDGDHEAAALEVIEEPTLESAVHALAEMMREELI